jgi:hypothetical protein
MVKTIKITLELFYTDGLNSIFVEIYYSTYDNIRSNQRSY